MAHAGIGGIVAGNAADARNAALNCGMGMGGTDFVSAPNGGVGMGEMDTEAVRAANVGARHCALLRCIFVRSRVELHDVRSSHMRGRGSQRASEDGISACDCFVEHFAEHMVREQTNLTPRLRKARP